ncbi:MAG: hypothetical protein HZA51_04940 [Planctomycetes bacterium]|nr:hypothetical protein [Planctomycetota bacterium]
MTIKEAALRVVDGLEEVGIAYMLVGSLSSSTYGIPRATQDADFVIQLSPGSLDRLMALLGPGFKLDHQMSFETVTATTRYKMELPGTGFTIELFLLSDDTHDQERFRRRVRKVSMGRAVWLPTAEDVIIMKLRWSKDGKRTKDVEDVRSVLSVQKNLDWAYIHHWCDQHGTRELLEQIRAGLPPAV